MVLGTGVYVPVRSNLNEGLWVIPVPVVHQTPLELHQAYYNTVLFLDGDYINLALCYTWKYVSSETTKSE